MHRHVFNYHLLHTARGASEGSNLRPSAFREDLRSLGRNCSFVLATLAFTCVAFSAGSLMWWGPQFAYYGAKAECGAKAGCENISQVGGLPLTVEGPQVDYSLLTILWNVAPIIVDANIP